jgi:hypothetical protein
MASNDWDILANSLLSTTTPRGATRGLTPPNGGGSFVYGINTLSAVSGAVGVYATPQAPNTNFNPTVKGAEVSAAVQRGVGGGTTGMAAFLFLQLQGTDVADEGYILGLSDAEQSHICLRKGALSGGLPDEAPGGANGILRRGTEVITPGTWVHLRFEAVLNDNGDVVLNVQQSNLADNTVSAPVWEDVPGVAQFIDDAIGVNSGSLPFEGGRLGFGARLADSARRAYFDHVIVAKQT